MTLYLKHFELLEAPFKITPTTEFFYAGGQRGEILHALMYAVTSGEGIMMVSGEVGSGKTMLLRTMIEKLPENTDVVYIPNPSLSDSEILYHICEELGLEIVPGRADMVRRLQNYLIEKHSSGRRVIAFIDEAQAMPDESLEEIRLLSNLETSRHKLLQVILWGQPELDDKLRRQNMRQLRERITVVLKLEPFGLRDIREYISTRLSAAGYNGPPLFADDSSKLIALVSQGLSRRINVLADKAMLSAFERNSLSVSSHDVKRAIKDVKFSKMRYRSEISKRFYLRSSVAAVAVSCIFILFIIGLRITGEDTKAISNVANSEQHETTTETNNADNTYSTVSVQVSKDKQANIVEKNNTQTLISAIDAEQDDGSEKNQQTKMREVIVGMELGKSSLDSDDLSKLVDKVAEEHGDVPQTNTKQRQEGWEYESKSRKDFIDNPRWHWMPKSSYLRNRLNATQTWLLGEEKSNAYTARLLTVSQKRGVFLERFLRHLGDFYPLRNVMIYPMQLRSGNKFVLTFGVYASRADAEVFLNNIPSYFVGGSPFAQQIKSSVEEALFEDADR